MRAGREYFGNQCGFESGLSHLQGGAHASATTTNHNGIKGNGANSHESDASPNSHKAPE